MFVMAIIPTYTLLFLKTELEFGGFLSYLGLLGFIISYLLSRKSDGNGQRMSYLVPLFLLMAFVMVLLPFISSTIVWVGLIGAYTLLNTASSPLRLAISLDVKKATLSFWMVRELFLNIGRFVTILISVVGFYFEFYWPVFMMFALMGLMYPLLVRWKLKGLR